MPDATERKDFGLNSITLNLIGCQMLLAQFNAPFEYEWYCHLADGFVSLACAFTALSK